MHKMEQPKRDVWEFINRSKHRTCISNVTQSIRTPLSSPCQLRPGVQLSYLRLSHYTISESESVRREAESELYQKGNAHAGVVTGLCITVLCDTIIR